MSRLRSVSTLAIATLTVASAVVLALGAMGAAKSFSARLNLPEPLIREPGPVAPPPPRLARRVVVFLVDGLRYDSSRTMASLESLRARGAAAEAVSHYPTFSRPNYISIFAGVPPRLSGARTNNVRGPVHLDTVFERAEEAGLHTRYLTGFASGGGDLFAPWLDDAASVYSWPGMMLKVAKNALADGDPFLVIHFAAVDDAGHAEGADSDEYRAAVTETDAAISELLPRLDLARDAVVVVADHGHIDEGGHGGLEPEVTQVPLILAGAGVRAGAAIREPRLIDVAPTLCALLGLPAPKNSVGRTLIEALDITPEVAAPLMRVDLTRAIRLGAAAGARANRLETLAWLRRGLRLLVVATLITVLILALRGLARRELIRLDRRVIFLAVPAFPILFYGLVGLFEPFLTPSMMPPEGDVIDMLLRYGAVAAAINVAIIWLAVAWRIEHRERLAAATGVVLVGLLVALVPAGLAWIIVSPPYAAKVPGPTMMMLPPMTFAGVACYAVSAAVALFAEWAVFAARATSHPPQNRNELRD